MLEGAQALTPRAVRPVWLSLAIRGRRVVAAQPGLGDDCAKKHGAASGVGAIEGFPKLVQVNIAESRVEVFRPVGVPDALCFVTMTIAPFTWMTGLVAIYL